MTANDELTLKQAAELVGVKPDSLRIAIRRGKLHGELRESGRGPLWYVPRAEAERYRQEHARASTRTQPEEG